jgi:glycosyltransferase involved in cell wall biosynthesis
MTDHPRQAVRAMFLLDTPDGPGGTERATFQLAAALARSTDMEVSVVGVRRHADHPHFRSDLGSVPLTHLIDARSPAEMSSEEQPSHSDSAAVPGSDARSHELLAERLLAEFLAGDAPDVVVATTPTLLKLLCRVAPTTTAIVCVEHRATAARGASRDPLEEYGSSADALVSLTTAGSEWFRQRFGPDGPVIATIPNMLPTGFTPQSALTQPIVVAAGRLVTSKQFGHAIRAFGLARRAGWRLRIFGDGPERGTLQRLVIELDVHDHVDLVPTVPDLRFELAKASMLVITSTAEGFSLVALEALATGIPVLSYDCPVGPREIIDNGTNGHLIAPNDIDALAACMRRVIDEPAHLRSLAVGTSRSRARFAEATVVDAWRALLTRVAVATPRRRASR